MPDEPPLAAPVVPVALPVDAPDPLAPLVDEPVPDATCPEAEPAPLAASNEAVLPELELVPLDAFEPLVGTVPAGPLVVPHPVSTITKRQK